MSSSLTNIQSQSLQVGQGVEQYCCGGGGNLHDAHMLKLSPQPHVPLMLGLLKTNSLDSLDSTKSISVPRRVSCAFFSMNTLTPARKSQESHHYTAFIVLLHLILVLPVKT